MAEPKIIAVVGATGVQGGGVCRAILADPSGGFACRALTRDPNKDKARELASKGADVVKADLDDIESLKKAFAGAHGVYGVTNFWEHVSAEKEKAQAKNIADAAKAAGVKHVIWSTLEDSRRFMSPDDKRMPFLQGQYRVPHLDAKDEANAYFSGLPVTYLVTSFYWDNLYMFGAGPKKETDGTYTWTLPMGDRKLAGIAGEDIGKVAYGIFKAGQPYFGRTVGIAGEYLTIPQMSETLSKTLGVGPVRYNAVEPDVYRSWGFPSADELGNMFQFFRDFEDAVLGARSLEETRKLNPEVQDFETFVRENKDKILAATAPAQASV
jgi:uncharacterized protein YbjT (DUF2867 family)